MALSVLVRCGLSAHPKIRRLPSPLAHADPLGYIFPLSRLFLLSMLVVGNGQMKQRRSVMLGSDSPRAVKRQAGGGAAASDDDSNGASGSTATAAGNNGGTSDDGTEALPYKSANHPC